MNLEQLLAGLPQAPLNDPRLLVWFADGRLTADARESDRQPDYVNPGQLDDPIVQTQRLIQERVGAYFQLNRAVSFANQAGKKGEQEQPLRITRAAPDTGGQN